MDAQCKLATHQEADWHGVPSASGFSAGGAAAAERLAELLALRGGVLAEMSLAALARRSSMRHLDFKALTCIAQLEPMPTGRLAQILGMSSGGVTAILNRLEADGFIRRDRSMRDRREVSLCLNGERGVETVFPQRTSVSLRAVVAQHDAGEVERLLAFLTECLDTWERDATRELESVS